MNPQNKKQLMNQVFGDIEKTGENAKSQVEELLDVTLKKIDSQVNCGKFEAAYCFSVSKEEREKTMKEIKEVREKLWKEALKRARGKVNDAYDIYCQICSFD
jgi:hypothetical protein